MRFLARSRKSPMLRIMVTAHTILYSGLSLLQMAGPPRWFGRLHELDQVAGIVAYEDVRAMFHRLDPDDVGAAPAKLRGELDAVGDGERHVLVAVGVNVRIRLAPFIGQRLRSGNFEEFDVQRTIHQHR